jgi:hypothetical protein
MRSMSTKNYNQIAFFETIDSLIKQDISQSLTKECEPTILRLIELTQQYFSQNEIEKIDEYLLFKRLTFSWSNINGGKPTQSLVEFCSLPKYFQGFQGTLDFIGSLLTIFLETGNYESISLAVMKSFRNEILCNYHAIVDSVLFSDNTISIRFKENVSSDDLHDLGLWLTERWFQHTNNPFFLIKSIQP